MKFEWHYESKGWKAVLFIINILLALKIIDTLFWWLVGRL